MKLLRWLKPTLIDRYIAREVLAPALLGLLLFTFILLLQDIAILTGLLVSRNADFMTILRLLMNMLPHILALTIPMAFLLGVLLAFGRLASESEIIALRAVGISPARLVRPILALALLVSIVTMYVTGFGYPNANQSLRVLSYSLVVSKARTAIKPRAFRDDLLPNGRILLYVSDIVSGSEEWRDLFLYDIRAPQKPKVILARGGRLVVDKAESEARLDLTSGTIYAFDPVKPENCDEIIFKKRTVHLPFNEIFPEPIITLSRGIREFNVIELFRQIRGLISEGKRSLEVAPFRVEFHKRLAIPASCFVFGLLGLSLSLGSRKEARSAAFGVSIAVFFFYFVLFRLGEHFGIMGYMPAIVSMWAANVLFTLLALLLLYLNHREAAFDPLDFSRFKRFLPKIKWRRSAPMVVAAGQHTTYTHSRLGSRLDRYIAKSYFGFLALTLTSFWALYILAHFMDLFDDVQQHSVPLSVVLNYYLFLSPSVIDLLAPVAILVTTLTTLGVLSRRNEITAMKAGGISLYRIVLPVLVLAMLASLALFGQGEYILPESNRVARRYFNIIKGRPVQSTGYLERRWVMGRDGRFYNYEYLLQGATPAELSLFSLSVFDIDSKKWALKERLFAAQARWNGSGFYDLERGWRRLFGEAPRFTTYDATRTREVETPDYFRREDRSSDTLGFIALRRYIGELQTMGMDVIKLQVQLHKKIAFPTVAVIMAIIGIPFSFIVGRRGALYGVGISILVAIVFWACLTIFEAMGANALLPPLLATWAPNLLFGAAGLYLMLTLET